MRHYPKSLVAAEFARRAKQFHPNEEPMSIALWGLFRWNDIRYWIKTGQIIPNAGMTAVNRTIWCKPSQAFYDDCIKPLMEKSDGELSIGRLEKPER